MQNDVRSDDYRLVIGTDKGDVVQSKTENITYMGFTDDAAQLRMTINDKFIVGYFIYKNERYYLEPLNGFIPDSPNDLFVFYRSQDVIPNPNVKCGLTDVDNKTIELNNDNKSKFRDLLTQTGCLNIRTAIASDYDLYANKYGSNISAVMNQQISVLNNVNADYASAFNKVITFSIVVNYVSTSPSSSLETTLTATTSSGTLLTNFNTWASNGGFGVVHDIGSLWLRRAFDGGNGTIGLAYTPGVCSAAHYNILNGDFTTSNGFYGQLQAHESGHNFGCQHDAANTPYIMAPSINTGGSVITTWSPASIAAVNAQIAMPQCQKGSLALQGSPEANFTINATECKNSNIALNDASGFSPTSWSWSMPGGIPSSANSQNTSVSYSTTGAKNISLNVANAGCSGFTSSSITKTINIINFMHPTAACAIGSTNTATAFPGFDGYLTGIYNVTLGTINNTTLSAWGDGTAYIDFSCAQFATLSNITSPISISVTVGSFNSEFVRVFVDLNNDGIFQAGELLLSTSAGKGTISGTITIPNTAVRNTLLRMRVMSDINPPSGCTTPTYGQVEDYGLLISASFLPVELVNFNAINKGNENILDWNTASEINSSRFVIQKSKDGQNFTDIGTVKAAGTSTTAQSYVFTDTNPYVGINYYRLNQVDMDGKEEFSKIVSVVWMSEGQHIFSIYPNPTQDILTVDHTGTVETFEIVNTLGQIIKTIKPTGNTGQTEIKTTELISGIYFLRVNQNEIVRFVKD